MRATQSDPSRRTVRLIAWMIAAMLPVAAVTAPGAPWSWQFPLVYAVTAFALGVFVRPKNPHFLRAAHVFVLSGGAPVVVRLFFGRELTFTAVLHIAAVLVISIGLGYWLAERVRSDALVARTG